MDGDNKRPLEKEEMTLLPWLMGKINWAASQTRQDLSYSVLELSTKFKSGKLHDLKKANKAINRPINTPTKLPMVTIAITITIFGNTIFWRWTLKIDHT